MANITRELEYAERIKVLEAENDRLRAEIDDQNRTFRVLEKMYDDAFDELREAKKVLKDLIPLGGAYSMSISEKTPMTVEQAANFTGFSKAYIYKLIGAGKIPSYKPDSSRQGKVILCKEELQNFLFANKRASNKEID